MKVIDHLNSARQTLFSFELLPPLKGDTIESIYRTIEPLMEFSPSFINVTYHREEVIYKNRGQGLLEKRIVRKRPGTVGISSAIQFRFKVDVVPHLICGGFSQEETENALIDLDFIGIDNIFVVRGDNLENEKYFTPEPDGHAHAVDLVRQVALLNRGIYLDNEIENFNPTKFSIGVAGYPEKHFESPNLQTDLKYLKHKVDAGADYIITQMFYDNAKFLRFTEMCRAEGITVPIIPGLKPIATKKQLSAIPGKFYVDIPQDLVSEIEKCKNNECVRQAGIEWTIAQAKELVKTGVPCLHFFTMGKSENIRQIVKNVF